MAVRKSILEQLKNPRYWGVLAAYAHSQELSWTAVWNRLQGKRTALYRETVRGLREIMAARDEEFKRTGKVCKITRRKTTRAGVAS